MCLNVIDIKPESMDALNEVITCTKFDSSHENILYFGCGSGDMKQADLRQRICFTNSLKINY